MYAQTIADLDRGEIFEHRPHDEFIWIEAQRSPDGATLTVMGCYWAASGEYRFFDFRDPGRGWPPVPLADEAWVESRGGRPPVWREDGSIECYDDRAGHLAARTVLRREGDAMVVVERWADAEESIQAAPVRVEAEHEAVRQHIIATDPLCRLIQEEFPQYMQKLSVGPSWVSLAIRTEPPHGLLSVSAITGRPISVVFMDAGGPCTERFEYRRDIDGMRHALARITEALAAG